jgi:pimeloyl-ACP methyl ester carboxylesterase
MILTIETYDGYTFKGRLSLPKGEGDIPKLVILLDGAGPKTYNSDFCIFSEFLTDKGIAYFTFSKRGVNITDGPPYYTINKDEYKTYVPSNSVKDIFSIINAIRELKCLSQCKVYLLGCSEGAIIASLFATKYPDVVEALFLIGYSNINIKDLQKQQCSQIEGGDAMLGECFDAIERKDNELLLSKFGLTAEWFLESYNLKSGGELLPTLDLPIYIFQGMSDFMCGVQGVYDIEDEFIKLGKSNLTVNIYEKHGHGLEEIGSKSGELSEGRKSLLNTINNI